MSLDLPAFIKGGEPARLIPVVADSSREKRATSVLLAAMRSIPDFSHAMLASVGQRVGSKTKIGCFTEVAFHGNGGEAGERPDGLIMIQGYKKSWSALVEAKIGNAQISRDQVETYAALAKTHQIDAVLTISNQFTARPDHPPVLLPRKFTNKVAVYHWPWMWVLTQASLLQMENAIEDADQRFLLNEVVRYLSHPSVGIDGFDRMNREWKDVVKVVQSGGLLRKNAPEVESTVASWHEEERDLCLIMARHLARPVKLKIERKHREAPLDRLRDDCNELAEHNRLRCEIAIPDAASDLLVTADLRTRSIACSLRMAAPDDRKSTKARVNWLLKQLAKSDDPDLFVRASWPRAADTMVPLSVARSDPESLQTDNRSLAPKAFEVVLIRDIAARFAGAKTFIACLEELVPHFYDQAGQYLRPWQPPPPKPRSRDTLAESIEAEPEEMPVLAADAAAGDAAAGGG